MTIENAYNEYLKYIKNRLKIQSRVTLEERFTNIILPFFENREVASINKLDCLQFQNYLISKNYSLNYIKNTYYLLSGFLKWCNMCYDLKIEILNLCELPKYRKQNETDFYTYKEFKKFIKSVDNPIYKLFFEFMFFMGTRPGETMALKFHNLNFNSINIDSTISEHSINGSRVVNTPKTADSNRIIAIPLFLSIKLYRLNKYYINKYGKISDYFIFGGIKPLAPTTINRYKLKACNKANIRPITLHQFRHSHGTFLLDHKVSIKAISERLGHSDASTTMNIYLHTTKKQEKRMLRALNFVSISLFR